MNLPVSFLETFVSCWAASRGHPTSIVHGRYPAGLRHNQTGDWEYYALKPSSEDFERLTKTTMESPARMLTIVSNDLETYKLQGQKAGFDVLEAVELVMVQDISSLGESHPENTADSTLKDTTDDGFSIEWEEQDVNGHTLLTVKFTQDGQLAASGVVVVAAIRAGADGDGKGQRFAVFDRIVTVAEFRRRGLGSKVIGELCQRAASLGATTGLLFASLEGQHLYKRLGWSTAYQVIIFGNLAGNPLVEIRRREHELEAQKHR